jgi:3-oxoacid CoA-transferase
LPGSSYFDSSISFGMIRGGHVDVAIMGGLQVDEKGNLANWTVPGKPLLGVGGAMDLASGAETLIVTMTHSNKDDASKVVKECDLPLTALGVVDVLITNLGVFRINDVGLTLVKLMPGITLEQVQESTQADFQVSLE